jgi:hypothetical protein
MDRSYSIQNYFIAVNAKIFIIVLDGKTVRKYRARSGFIHRLDYVFLITTFDFLCILDF